MRIPCLIAGFVFFTSVVTVPAEERTFPYEAVIDVADGDDVWSGPSSKKFYPTSHLNRGQRVKVVRHDPGGWCMIEPPEGSFSWIRASHVQKNGPNHGSLKQNRIVVHVGSDLNPDDFTTIQAELSKDADVEILGEKSFQVGDEAPRVMLKIAPPKGEWRWIARKSIVPIDAFRNDPFPSDHPKKRTGPIAEQDDDAFAKPVSTGPVVRESLTDSSSNEATSSRTETATEKQAGKQRLTEIDQQFREMIQNDPPTWDLDTLEQQYRQLDADVGLASMTSTIKLRVDAVKRYRKVYKDYIDFYKLSSETKERDAQLQQQQAQFQPDSVKPSPMADPQQAPTPITQPGSSAPVLGPAQPVASGQAPAAAPSTGPTPSFDGAGIVQRITNATPGGPQFVLIAPDGRMLSVLQPGPGVDLNRYNGRPMGVIGPRVRREDWNADVITVRSLQPVQLRGMR
ncbi:SH3 domain-containing protein [Schlesneria paludicola]|uniref:hypothetical protein n=1 Tax=Schlesneria paludicola TaxID=360056 RepID=UPI00029A4B7C|nr:hypothetical protein [Schlesneria paludicola]